MKCNYYVICATKGHRTVYRDTIFCTLNRAKEVASEKKNEIDCDDMRVWNKFGYKDYIV